MMRWIGGFSHVLRFTHGSFDFVFANAALHRIRDIPAAISEMLRVLRPGGYLISIGRP
jgi:ubiquinone/menaquinone biosynthesis C-methylase UbiE